MALTDYFRSTPFRIVAAYTVLFVTSVAVLFVFLYWSVTREMTAGLQAAIEEDTRPLVASYAEGRLQRMVEAIRERALAAKPGETLILLQTAGGNVIEGNVSHYPPFTGWRELTLRGVGSPGGGPERPQSALALGVRLDNAFLLVGRSLEQVENTQRLLIRSLAWIIAMTVVLALVGGAVLSRGAIRRIETINRTFEEIVEGNFSRRIPTRASRDELDQLAVNINLTLDRIEQLVEDLQQVTNDIAHDLRTPLGRLRQGLESTRLKGSSIPEYQTAVDHAIEQVDTILDTFAALLRIAQVNSHARRERFSDLDLSEIAGRIADAYESVVEDAGQSFSAAIAPDVHVSGDKDLMTQLIANLVENATRHSPEGAKVEISLTKDPIPTLTVTDTGPGIPPEMREAVLRRFYRLDESRSSAGSGLGLALVKAIADLHNAELELSDNEPGLSVSLRFKA
jgi:signal transduction histidine kinase